MLTETALEAIWFPSLWCLSAQQKGLVIQMEELRLFTAESVTEGHPDKLCDRISDAVLDAYLEKDPDARVACETAVTTGLVTIMGEITSRAEVDLRRVVRNAIRDVGYIGQAFGFDADTCGVVIAVDRQSEDIDAGVSHSLEQKQGLGCHLCDVCKEEDVYAYTGAGDQGIMFGYACDETNSLMPAPAYYAHLLCRKLSRARKDGSLDYLGPDGKAMVTFAYEDGRPVRIHTIVVSVQHKRDVSQEQIRQDIISQVISPVFPEELRREARILINPTGRFIKGGPCADTGLTGRKIMVGSYGGMGRHGGGAFSGKDPTKVDRTGAYAARYVAKNIVASGIARRCEVQVAYAIGVAEPVSIHVDTFGTGQYGDGAIDGMVRALFDLRPAALIDCFDLRRPIYSQLSAYGHFGRDDLFLPWEKTDQVAAIQNYFR